MRNLFLLGIFMLTVGAGLWLFQNQKEYTITAPTLPKPTPLTKYSFENLKTKEYKGSEIKLERVIKKEPRFTSYIFSFETEGKKVTGQANLPAQAGIPDKKFPVVIMLRGYADKEIYSTGLGTRKAAGVFAENGFITLAPDFLGFGGSDWESADILEARFERPITVLNLLSSIPNMPYTNPQKTFLWGHSNGGQIALSVLEITQSPIPTTLWAPVTRGFPESITDYIGELDDQGKMVVASLSAFLKDYNPKEFSVTNYFQDINSPLQIHQGKADYLVKEESTREFVDKMKNLGMDVIYYTYPRNDHNLSRDWDTIVARDLAFFKKYLK